MANFFVHGDLTPAAWGSPTLQSRGQNQQRPQGFKEGDKIRCGPQVGRLATSPVPSTGAPTAESVGQNQEPPTSGGLGHINHLPSFGVPSARERETKSALANKWAEWPRNPAILGVPNASKQGKQWSKQWGEQWASGLAVAEW